MLLRLIPELILAKGLSRCDSGFLIGVTPQPLQIFPAYPYVSRGPRPLETERMPRFQEGACGPIIVKLSTSAPGALARMRLKRSSCARLSWVAQAVDEHWISSLPSSNEIGDACWAISAPTMVGQVAKRFPSANPESHSRSLTRSPKISLTRVGSPMLWPLSGRTRTFFINPVL